MHNKFPHKANNPAQPMVSQGEFQLSGVGNVMAATPKGYSRRLHRKQAADFLGMSLSWLDKARLNGDGPVFLTMGGRVLYDSRDLEAFIDRSRHTSTAEQY